MKQFNIYAGKKGSMTYLYTTLCEDIYEAQHIAENEMIADFEANHVNHDVMAELESKAYFVYPGFAQLEEIDKFNHILNEYRQYQVEWGSFLAIETSQDGLSEDDLILDYVSNNEG